MGMEKGPWIYIERASGILGAACTAATLYYTAGLFYGWNEPRIAISPPTAGREQVILISPWLLISLGSVAVLLLATAWIMIAVRVAHSKRSAAPAQASKPEPQASFALLCEACFDRGVALCRRHTRGRVRFGERVFYRTDRARL